MIRAIEMGWFVLDKYYNMTEEAPVYAAALLLDRRAAYIRKNWPVSWVEPAIEAANALWEENFKEGPVPNDESTPALIRTERHMRATLSRALRRSWNGV
jgi:hypothetical protein